MQLESLLPTFPTGHSGSSHCVCTKHDTDKDSQQPPNSSRTQIVIWHTDTELRSDQDQSGSAVLLVNPVLLHELRVLEEGDVGGGARLEAEECVLCSGSSGGI